MDTMKDLTQPVKIFENWSDAREDAGLRNSHSYFLNKPTVDIDSSDPLVGIVDNDLNIKTNEKNNTFKIFFTSYENRSDEMSGYLEVRLHEIKPKFFMFDKEINFSLISYATRFYFDKEYVPIKKFEKPFKNMDEYFKQKEIRRAAKISTFHGISLDDDRVLQGKIRDHNLVNEQVIQENIRKYLNQGIQGFVGTCILDDFRNDLDVNDRQNGWNIKAFYPNLPGDWDSKGNPKDILHVYLTCSEMKEDILKNFPQYKIISKYA
jgi:hypothetical protein